MKCCSSLIDIIFLRITSLSRILACEILASQYVQRCDYDVQEEAGSIQPSVQHCSFACFMRDPRCFAW